MQTSWTALYTLISVQASIQPQNCHVPCHCNCRALYSLRLICHNYQLQYYSLSVVWRTESIYLRWILSSRRLRGSSDAYFVNILPLWETRSNIFTFLCHKKPEGKVFQLLSPDVQLYELHTPCRMFFVPYLIKSIVSFLYWTFWGVNKVSFRIQYLFV